MTEDPWAHEEWPEEPERDPEQGAQPDHGTPAPAWRPRLIGPGQSLCPMCLAMNRAPSEYDRRTGFQLVPRERRLGRNVSVAVDRSLYCLDCDVAFSKPMDYAEAMAYLFGDQAA